DLAPLAALEITKRVGVAAEVLGLLRERVIQMQLGVLAWTCRELALDLGDLNGGEPRLRDLRERRPTARVPPVARERAAIGVCRAREVADELLRRAEVVLVLSLARVTRDRAAKRLERLGVRAGAREHDADRIERERALRLERERALRGLERLTRPVQRDQAT